MGNKNANGDGSFYPIKKGKWRATITIGRSPEGRLIRKSLTRKSRKLAREALKELKEKYGGQVVLAMPTVSEFSAQWQAEHQATWKANTIRKYKSVMKNHIYPRIGRKRLIDLRPIDIQSWVNSLVNDEVGVPTICDSANALNTMLIRAVQLELLNSNPYVHIRLPRRTKRAIHVFTVEEARQIVELGEKGDNPGLWKLAFQTGMRIGELFGLHWSDVNFKLNEIQVTQQLLTETHTLEPPKTPSSVRTIMVSDSVLESLNLQRRENVRRGFGNIPHVFANQRGGFIWASSFYESQWEPILSGLCLEYRTFHNTRHTFATLAITDGVPITTVSQILGHSNPATTMKIYAHAIQQEQSQSVQSMKRLFG